MELSSTEIEKAVRGVGLERRGFGCVVFEMSGRHPSGSLKQALRYMNLEFQGSV